LSFGMTGHKRHPTIFPVISMRLQDAQFCAECFAEERSHSYEGVYRPSEADLPSAYLLSLASVKKVLSRGNICLKKEQTAARSE
jgi:hypothetical protein